MDLTKIMKLLGLISMVVILNIIVLSPGLLNVEIGGESVLKTAFGVTLLCISFLVVLYGSYILLFRSPAIVAVKELRTHEDYVTALEKYRTAKVLKKDITLALDQLVRIEKRRNILLEILSQRFEPTELSFKKFKAISYEVEKLFYLNIRGILNKLSVFDATEFSLLASSQRPTQFSDKLVQKKTALYNEYFAYVTGYLGANEEILLKLDKLLLEISLLDSTDYKDVEDMPCMKELDDLIKQTKFYKQ